MSFNPFGSAALQSLMRTTANTLSKPGRPSGAYYTPNGSWVSPTTGVTTFGKKSYNAKTNPMPSWDTYQALANQAGGGTGGAGYASDLLYGDIKPSIGAQGGPVPANNSRKGGNPSGGS